MKLSLKSIIVGIDPGTTIGYACLSLDGMVLKTYSSKELDIASVIHNISKIGLPVIVAS
ncbi:MAG: DUF460 domain-containing protein, partial [Nanoarchaeota archaeon]